ncbi:MAG: cob(I)yrinic acid a,c-diamide adenosyltransferase [Nitrospirae bacterium]|nr:cob(I)yrinic acid a,c-diamide adenosyltransferase [Nitrospirota bacterium]
MAKGCIHIYTGNGKGKTTAVVGLALRAKSRGLRVLFVQFMKGSMDSGEISLLKSISVKIKKFPKILSPYFHPDIDKKKLQKHAKEAVTYLKKIMADKKFDMIILDEFNCLLKEGILTDTIAIDLLSVKPAGIELILTGRGATKKLIRASDYVTDMRMIKHPFSKGIKAREGIEY